jgi:hypothetical protein
MSDRLGHPSQHMQSHPDREPSIMDSPLTSWRSSIPSPLTPHNNNRAKLDHRDWSPISAGSQATTQASPMSLPIRGPDQPDVWARLSGRLVIGKDCKGRAGMRVVSAEDINASQTPLNTALGTICEVLHEGLCTVQWDFEKTSARCAKPRFSPYMYIYTYIHTYIHTYIQATQIVQHWASRRVSS